MKIRFLPWTCSFVLGVSLALAPPLFGQCTDADGDTFYYEAGCGTAQDCNDANADTHPGAVEACDGYDNDCDGQIDNDASCDTTCDLPGRYADDLQISDDTEGMNAQPSMVWTGAEYGMVFLARHGGIFQLRFARVDPFGEKVGDTVPIRDLSDRDVNATLVWTGSEYGLTWSEVVTAGEEREILFVRIDVEGNKIGAVVRVTNDPGQSYEPTLAWNGSGYGLVWDDDRAAPTDDLFDLYFTRLDPLGNKIGGDVRLTNSGYSWTEPSLVWTGALYGVAWADDREGDRSEIYFARFDSVGNLVGSETRVTDVDSWGRSVSLVWTGLEYGMSWQDDRDPIGDQTYFVRVDATGSKIGTETRVSDGVLTTVMQSLAWTGSEFGLAWEGDPDRYSEVYFTRIDASGIKIGADVRVDDPIHAPEFTLEARPVLAWAGADYGVLWRDAGESVSEPYFQRVGCACPDSDGDSYSECADCDDANPNCTWDCTDLDGDGFCVTSDCDDTISTCTTDCTDGDLDGFLGCADDCDDTDAAIHPDATEVCDGVDNDCDGEIDEYPVCDFDCDLPDMLGGVVHVSTESLGAWHPSVAWSGSEYGVTYADEGEDYLGFSRVDAGGEIVGNRVPVGWEGHRSHLVWAGTEYAVAYEEWEKTLFSRFDSSGNPLAFGLQVSSSTSDSVNPSLDWTGSEYAAAWGDYRHYVSSEDPNTEIYFARLDATGNRIGSDVRVTDAVGASDYPSVAWTGTEFGVAWKDERDGVGKIYFVRFDSAGNKIGSDIRITPGAGVYGHPSLVWNGSGYGLAWEALETGTRKVYFTRLDASGTRIGSDLLFGSSSSSSPELVWTGAEYGLAWVYSGSGLDLIYFDRLDGLGNKLGTALRLSEVSSGEPSLTWTGPGYAVAWTSSFQIYLARIGCDCTENDGDGVSSCNDCDDDNPNCITDCTDDDGDGFCVTSDCDDAKSYCTTDCTDVDSDGYCVTMDCDDDNPNCTTDCTDDDGDGFCVTSDCDDAKSYCTTDCTDADGDGYCVTMDCDEADDRTWFMPGEARDLTFLNDRQTLNWNPPSEPGCSDPLLYDTLRSESAGGFASGATCIETHDGSDTTAEDVDIPADGIAYYYLTCAVNACGRGSAGMNSFLTERELQVCP